MMFQGTYSSEFYRAVRDLLHEQVAVEKLNLPQANRRYQSARREVQTRWEALLAREPSFRLAAETTAAAIGASHPIVSLVPVR